MLAGNPGKRPLNENEPDPPKKRPYKPRHLSRAASREWDRIAPKLDAVGLLTTIDGSALALYCEAYADWVQAKRDVERRGQTIEVSRVSKKGDVYLTEIVNPSVAIAAQAYAQLCKLLREFGMTPSARTNISVEKKPEKKRDSKASLFTA